MDTSSCLSETNNNSFKEIYSNNESNNQKIVIINNIEQKQCNTNQFILSLYGSKILNTVQSFVIPLKSMVVVYSNTNIESTNDGLKITKDNYLTFDLGDIIRTRKIKNSDPEMIFSHVKNKDGFKIYASNNIQDIGILSYTFINNTKCTTKKIIIPSFGTDHSSLCIHGTIPYRYITIKGIKDYIIINHIQI